jgi:hypothetical protein
MMGLYRRLGHSFQERKIMKRALILALVACASLASAQNYQANVSCTPATQPTGTTITGYAFYRAIHASSSYSLLNSTPVSTCAYTDTTVLNGTSYDYYVETVATVTGTTGPIQSAPSSVLTIAIPSTVVLPPTSPTGTITGQQIALTVDTKTNTVTAKVTMIEGPTKTVKVASK